MTTLETPALGEERYLEDLSPRELAAVMLRIQRMRRDKIEELKSLTVQVADAVKTATTVRARAFLAHEGPQDERTQVGRLSAADAVFAADALKGELEACREVLKLLKDDWDTARSINANSRAERSAIEGYGN